MPIHAMFKRITIKTLAALSFAAVVGLPVQALAALSLSDSPLFLSVSVPPNIGEYGIGLRSGRHIRRRGNTAFRVVLLQSDVLQPQRHIHHPDAPGWGGLHDFIYQRTSQWV